MKVAAAPRKLDRNLPVPLHFQIRALLIEMVERGEIEPGRPLPSERELAARYDVSLSPIRQAILDLVKEGVLYRRRGAGTFLREPPRTERVSVLTSFSESLRARGVDVHVDLLAQRKVPTPAEIADLLTPPTRRVILIERVTIIEGIPAAALRSHLPGARFPGLEHAELPRGSLYGYLESVGVRPVRAETTVQVVPCSSSRSERLRVAIGAPLLQASGVVFDAEDDVIEVFEVQYRSDSVRLRFDTIQTAEDMVGGGGARAP
jgi:GntR family transcriptional regulator